MNLKDYSNAINNLSLALDLSKDITGYEHPDTAIILKNMAAVYERIGDKNAAIKHYQEAYAIREKIFGGKAPQTKEIQDKITLLLTMPN